MKAENLDQLASVINQILNTIVCDQKCMFSKLEFEGKENSQPTQKSNQDLRLHIENIFLTLMLYLLYKKLKCWSDVKLKSLIAAREDLLFLLKIAQGGKYEYR